MTVLIGRGATPAVALETRLVSGTAIEADLPDLGVGEADDLFVAVRAASGAVTNSLPVQSTHTEIRDVAGHFEPDEVGITGTFADLTWNVPNQQISLEGVGLTSGARVRFTRRRGRVEESFFSTAEVQPTMMAFAALDDEEGPRRLCRRPHRCRTRSRRIRV